uniref:Transposable element P transposase n=1 Tax=Schizaphis graminum TaxID=13262 RepID=A0A2S2NYW9_SCHGA
MHLCMVLAQLVIKAISILENSGAKIDGIVSDGASTNRKLWIELGISGSMDCVKNSIIHPLDDFRKIFMFSDAPHLIKNVRNRLLNKKSLRISPQKPFVRWSHFIDVFENDNQRSSTAPTKICPKITKRHLIVDNFSKMSVKLATQVLSDSIAKGIEFYREHEKVESLKNSNETQKFVDIFNRTFDALNRKYPAEGIRNNSIDFDVLEDTYAWLNSWENCVKNKLISEDEYLTKNTSDGLRVTIKSTIELSKYLINDCGYSYVLSSKMNQDRLEQFFGMARQATGPNDHPTTPTFIQIYKMLSVYSILKPPKTGNCKILEKNTPKITLNDIKSIFVNDKVDKEDKLLKLQERLDLIVKEGKWETEDVFESDIHNYCTPNKAEVTDCVIYYISGFVCRYILKHTNCDVCINALKGKVYSSKSEAAFTNLKSRGKLIHPNEHFHNIISAIENSFSKYCTMPSVFQDTIDNFIENNTSLLTFPCDEHKNEVLMFIIRYYITTRMRQFASIENKNQKKINLKKKKSAKLVIT